jgi:ergothioneine biosynthesis protein EgtB
MSLAQLQEQAAYERSLASRFTELRARGAAMVADLSAEDCNLQAMPEASPAKWHLAHTTWFFETFLLEPFAVGYLPVDSRYSVLFNSYYNGVGEQFPRAQRGLLSRPTLDEVQAYRKNVDAAVLELLGELDPQAEHAGVIFERVELGLHHEAQHQELLLTDLKYNLFQNPLFPAYRPQEASALAGNEATQPVPLAWVDCDGGEVSIGHAGNNGFCFDNELPRHKVRVPPFRMSNRLVTNAEYLAFVEAGGYQNPQHWLSDGWAEIQQQGSTQPLYWGCIDGQWFEYTLNGLQPLDLAAPVSHVSYFEAQAYAAWFGQRLPTEAEWESVAAAQACAGNFADAEHLHPQAADIESGAVGQLYGDCWEWTNSAYLPYPGYRAPAGAVGEYNGKFMSGQMVLRGGSCLSRAFHIRASYRNFFYPRDRWQCTGIRLAADV